MLPSSIRSIAYIKAQTPSLQKGDPQTMTGSFIDTMRPITPGERLAWGAYLALPFTHWRAARAMFRRAHCGSDVENNLLQFVGDTGFLDGELLTSLETALRALERERG
jgi:hypothetical protein